MGRGASEAQWADVKLAENYLFKNSEREMSLNSYEISKYTS